MRIAVDASRYQSTAPTGVEVYSNYLLEELQKIALSEHVSLCLLSPNEKQIQSSEYSTQKILRGRKLWTLGRLSTFFAFNKTLFDVLFVPSHILPLFLPKRAVVTIHDVAWKYFPESYSWKQRLLLDFSTKFSIRYASKIIVVSDATKKDLVKFYHCPVEKIAVVHSGFDKDIFLRQCFLTERNTDDICTKYGVEEGKYFLYTGRLEEKKNIPFLIEAFLKANLPHPWKLVLVGKPGVGFERIEQLLRSDEKGSVIATGYLPNQDTYALLQKARASVLVSKYEGFGFPLLEAFALDVPVIASSIPALREIGGDAPYFIRHDQINTLIQALKVFAQEKYDNSNMIQKGQERLHYFSWKKCAEAIWTILVGEEVHQSK